VDGKRCKIDEDSDDELKKPKNARKKKASRKRKSAESTDGWVPCSRNPGVCPKPDKHIGLCRLNGPDGRKRNRSRNRNTPRKRHAGVFLSALAHGRKDKLWIDVPRRKGSPRYPPPPNHTIVCTRGLPSSTRAPHHSITLCVISRNQPYREPVMETVYVPDPPMELKLTLPAAAKEDARGVEKDGASEPAAGDAKPKKPKPKLDFAFTCAKNPGRCPRADKHVGMCKLKFNPAQWARLQDARVAAGQTPLPYISGADSDSTATAPNPAPKGAGADALTLVPTPVLAPAPTSAPANHNAPALAPAPASAQAPPLTPAPAPPPPPMPAPIQRLALVPAPQPPAPTLGPGQVANPAGVPGQQPPTQVLVRMVRASSGGFEAGQIVRCACCTVCRSYLCVSGPRTPRDGVG
jgi:hypothetical protein